MATQAGGTRQTARQVATDHEGFLRHASFRWLKIAVAVCLRASDVRLLLSHVGFIERRVEPFDDLSLPNPAVEVRVERRDRA